MLCFPYAVTPVFDSTMMNDIGPDCRIQYPVTNYYQMSFYKLNTEDKFDLGISDQYIKYRQMIFDRQSYQYINPRTWNWALKTIKRNTDNVRYLVENFQEHYPHIPKTLIDSLPWNIYCDFLIEQGHDKLEKIIREILGIHQMAMCVVLSLRPTEYLKKQIKKEGKRPIEARVQFEWEQLIEEVGERCSDVIASSSLRTEKSS